jgi:F-type H+-transporting ATPase subunit c
LRKPCPLRLNLELNLIHLIPIPFRKINPKKEKQMSFFTMCVLAAGIGMALGTLGTGIGQGLAVKSAVEGVSRNPGASGKILTTMMIGLAMIESLAIYALVVCLIILFANPYKDVALKLAETVGAVAK